MRQPFKKKNAQFLCATNMFCISLMILQHFIKLTLNFIPEKSLYSFGNFRKLSLYICFMPI